MAVAADVSRLQSFPRRTHGNYQEAIPIFKSHFRLEFRRKRVGEIATLERIDLAAAGLRHSRAPFPPGRDCAESQSQQRDHTNDPSFLSEIFYENRYKAEKRSLSRQKY